MVASEFFRWFHLRRVGEGGDGGETTYRPEGEAFRSLVCLVVQAGARGDLQRLDLHVARTFIDDPAQSAFARDIVKSFCLSAAPSAGVASLANELMFREVPGPVLMRGARPQLDAEASEAFQVVAGRRAATILDGGPVHLRLSNAEAEADQLTISAVCPASDSATPGLFARIWRRLRTF